MAKKQKLRRINDIQTGKALPTNITHYSHSRHPAAAGRRAAQVPPPSSAPEYTGKPRWRRVLKRITISIFLLVFGLVLVLGVWDVRNISAASAKIFGTGNILSLLGSGGLKTDSSGRVNVLIAGYSADDPNHPAANLTDSILLLSMNPAAHTGYMLSIPRDLYVKIPGFGYAKINEAYQDGGIGLLEQVIQTDFQTQIGYYTIVDYAAVRDIVNSLGGISVNIKSPDPRGLYDGNISKADGGPLNLPDGVQTLNGQTALNLTRARGDTEDSYGFPQSDFDRTQHQRQVFTAIKDKLNWKLVLNPRKNSQILNATASNIKTDVPASQVRQLFGLFNSIPSAKLQSFSLRDLNGQNYLGSYTTVYGQSALVPAAGIDDYSQIRTAISQL